MHTRPPRSLLAHEIESSRTGRRSALAALGGAFCRSTLGGAFGLSTLGVLGAPGSAAAKATDSDANDGEGHGRTGVTDRDAGEGSDGAGRGVCPARGWSDSDPSDGAGRGRGPCR